MEIFRPEHPTPQWERKNWRNLNGEWEFDFDFGKSAVQREVFKQNSLPMKINIPFCPESKLSGIGHIDFIPAVCYKKTITLSKEDLSYNVLLHFGAVDFHSYIYINGELCEEHIGGFASFEIDITKFVKEGENNIFVIAEDDVRSHTQPAGKQCIDYASRRCLYTRTTGIWQTVWLEFVPKNYIKNCKYYPDITNGILTVVGEVSGCGELQLISSYEGKPTGNTKINVSAGFFTTQIKLTELHLWEVGHGRLYDLELKFGDDTVKSYFGMREVRLEGLKFMLNNKPVFLKTVLDQGYYPDGIMTAKTDEELRNDILLSKAVGFNGARLHQKVFEKRFLYHCDKEGYLVWGEHGNWGLDYANPVSQGNFISEWTEILERDFNSPSIIGWCPFNETWEYKERETPSRLIESTYRLTKLFDKTRPCIDTSGNYHISKFEIYDIHDYEQNTEVFKSYYSRMNEGIIEAEINDRRPGDNGSQPWNGEPVFVSEYGGIKWAATRKDGWGYGNAPKTLEEYTERFCTLTETLISNPYIMGLCYTQLYDIEQEQNGIYYYDRTPKFDSETMAKLKSAMDKKPAIEE